MKFIKSKSSARASQPPAAKLDRRSLVVGAGVAGVAGAAAALLHRGGVQSEPVVARAKPAPDTASGYQLTPHVQRYYETAKS